MIDGLFDRSQEPRLKKLFSRNSLGQGKFFSQEKKQGFFWQPGTMIFIS